MTDSSKKEVRVRFAPSPTGPLHIGGARTALFNWLFAKNHGGQFILRIEDTDKERSNPEYEKNILDGLRWLGLEWDEGPSVGDYGPYRQSERLDIYEKYLKQLLDNERAYWCFCSKEQLESDRQAMLAQGFAPKYSGRCRSLSNEENQKRIERGEPAVIRFKIPEVAVEFTDIIRGRVKFDASLIGDMVIAKSLTEPLYNFSNVIDDELMKITHVIRGEEHLSNTPKQICIQKSLGFSEVKYAHLPLILAPDRSKLSKRSLETSLEDYKKQGYLPEAILNFIALLGWHPAPEQSSVRGESAKEREIFTREELVELFDLKRVQKAGAIFDLQKLEWLNSQYLKILNPKEIASKLKDFIPAEWLEDENFLIKIIAIEKERLKKLIDFRELAEFFFVLPDYEPELLFWPRPRSSDLPPVGDIQKTFNNLKLLRDAIEKIFKADFSKKNIEEAIMPLTEVWGRGELLWPLRGALSGKPASPGPFEIMETLGKEETLKRIEVAIKKNISLRR